MNGSAAFQSDNRYRFTATDKVPTNTQLYHLNWDKICVCVVSKQTHPSTIWSSSGWICHIRGRWIFMDIIPMKINNISTKCNFKSRSSTSAYEIPNHADFVWPFQFICTEKERKKSNISPGEKIENFSSKFLIRSLNAQCLSMGRITFDECAYDAEFVWNLSLGAHILFNLLW